MDRKIMFLGDSLTEWGKWNDYFPGIIIQNNGVAGDKTTDILLRIKERDSLEYDSIFFMAGINDLGNGRSPDETFEIYKRIPEILMHQYINSKIFIQSVLPVAKTWCRNGILTPENIISLNRMIAGLENRKTIYYIDIHSHFEDDSAYIYNKYSDDGLHLNQEGYMLWAELIKKIIYE